jgi:hypothetical protein
MTESPYVDPHPSGSGGGTPTGEYHTIRQPEEPRERIPAWAVTTVAVAAATASLIAWGEVRFVRRDVYDMAHVSALSDIHRLDERVTKHENDQATVQRDMQSLTERTIRMEEKIGQIADKLGVHEDGDVRRFRR